MTPTSRNILILVVIVIVATAGYIMTRPDNRTTTERMGDAIHALPQGVDKATSEFKDDHTPTEKLGDAVRDAGDKIKQTGDSK